MSLLSRPAKRLYDSSDVFCVAGICAVLTFALGVLLGMGMGEKFAYVPPVVSADKKPSKIMRVPVVKYDDTVCFRCHRNGYLL